MIGARVDAYLIQKLQRKGSSPSWRYGRIRKLFREYNTQCKSRRTGWGRRDRGEKGRVLLSEEVQELGHTGVEEPHENLKGICYYWKVTRVLQSKVGSGPCLPEVLNSQSLSSQEEAP